MTKKKKKKKTFTIGATRTDADEQEIITALYEWLSEASATKLSKMSARKAFWQYLLERKQSGDLKPEDVLVRKRRDEPN